MLSVNVFFIRYAQEARGYALSAFLVLSSWLLLIRCVQRPTWFTATAYALVSAAAPWVQFLNAAMYPAQFAALLFFLRPGRRAWRYLIPAALIVSISTAAIAVLIVQHDIGQASWLRRPSLTDLVNLDYDFAGAPFGRIGFSWTVRILYAIGMISGLVVMLKNRNNPASKQSIGLGCAILAGLVPPIVVFVASQRIPMFQDRYLFMSLPFIVLFVAAGLSAISPAPLSTGLILLIAAFSIPIDRVLYVWQPAERPAWFDAIPYIRNQARPADKMVLVPGYCRLGLDYNLDKSGGSAGFPSIEYPRWDGFMQYGGRHFTDRAVMQPNPLLMSVLKSKPARLWVVSCDLVDFNTPDVLAATSSSYGGCTSRVFRSLMILLCDSDANRRVGGLSSRR
jgi:mannosyltransferase